MLENIYKVLILDGSWKYIVTGLLATLKISVLSLLFGTILGFIVYTLETCRIKFLNLIAKIYIIVLRGTPVLMLLMMMYYVIFAKSVLDASTIAIVTFSMNSAAYIAEIIRSASQAVDKGQYDACITLGFSKREAFRYVVLPQIISISEPLYESEIISLIQWTSVVGYVAITDLTRVINNISSRTMKPVLLITVGMLLYLAMAYLTKLIIHLIKVIYKRIKSSRGSVNE